MNDLALNIRTMSSREIADLTGSRHDNVKRTIETLVNKCVIPSPHSEEKVTAGRTAREYHLDKRSSLRVVAQLGPVFLGKVVDRWQELEAAAQTGMLGLPDFTSPAAAARAWADQVEARERAEYQAAELASQNQVLAPKALIVDRINDAEGLHTMAEAAKILGTGRTRLFQFLRQEHIFDCHNMPLQQYIPNRFVVKERPFMRGDERQIYAQVFVTGRGITWLTPKVAGLGPDGQGEFFE